MKHLTLIERYQIFAFNEIGLNKSEIANKLNKHKSTISREFKRNKSPTEYDPEKANMKTISRKKNAHKHTVFNEEMKKIIEAKIKENCGNKFYYSITFPTK